MIKNIFFVFTLICFITLCYFAYRDLQKSSFEFWQSAYALGYKDGKKVSKAQHKLTHDQLKSTCMFLDYEK